MERILKTMLRNPKMEHLICLVCITIESLFLLDWEFCLGWWFGGGGRGKDNIKCKIRGF
jgi:hypothetical protein